MAITTEFELVFEELNREAVNQLHEYREFKYIYYSSERQIKLLNEAAKHFFGELFYILLERIVLNVSKLTDPPGKGDRQCLSLHYVHELFSSESRYPSEECSKLIDRAQAVRGHIETWRKKLVAHKDLAVALEQKDIGQVKPETIGEFYAVLAEYLEKVSQAFELGPCPIDTVAFGGASELVCFLQRGAVFNELFDKDPVLYDTALRRNKFHDL